jgi:RNA methyltransferase, TrmH family
MLVEGIRPVREALRSGARIHAVLHSAAIQADGEVASVLTELDTAGVHVLRVADNVFARIPDTTTPQGIVAITEIPEFQLRSPAEVVPLVLVADRIRDPGNMGTLVRSAHGAGATAVLVAPESADPFSPKVVRAGMGSHFWVPVRRVNWQEIARELEGITVAAAERDAEVEYDSYDWTQPRALIVGNETQGLSDNAIQLTTVRVGIPLAKDLDSLNAAIAGSIILFEAARQRRKEKVPLDRVHTHGSA